MENTHCSFLPHYHHRLFLPEKRHRQPPPSYLNRSDPDPPTAQKSINGVASHDIIVDHARELWFRVYEPTEHAGEDLPVIVFFHGGGFVYASPDVLAYDAVCRRFARKVLAIVISVNYRHARLSIGTLHNMMIASMCLSFSTMKRIGVNRCRKMRMCCGAFSPEIVYSC